MLYTPQGILNEILFLFVSYPQVLEHNQVLPDGQMHGWMEGSMDSMDGWMICYKDGYATMDGWMDSVTRMDMLQGISQREIELHSKVKWE